MGILTPDSIMLSVTMAPTPYLALTFAPVQTLLEKSRKLRDLYGASTILSYLSYSLLQTAQTHGCIPITPTPSINLRNGIPNRILLQTPANNPFTPDLARTTLRTAWRTLLTQSRQWIEQQIPPETLSTPYQWHHAWKYWEEYTWEFFWGTGDSIHTAMQNLEERKLKRDWIGITWHGESSSITGTDSIAWPGMSNPDRPLNRPEDQTTLDAIAHFYHALAIATNHNPSLPNPPTNPDDPTLLEGKFIAPNERLSIPELVKRLVTRPDVMANTPFPALPRGFKDLDRQGKLINDIYESGQWTGWFMGDGDHMGDLLKLLSQHPNGPSQLTEISNNLQQWSDRLRRQFSKQLHQTRPNATLEQLRNHRGRIIYAGGDDFLGVMYSQTAQDPIVPHQAYQWLCQFNPFWQSHGIHYPNSQPLSVSVGFVWVAPGVPQRDLLQHCREAQNIAKAQGRDRVCIRIVFNSGQYVQWTCPWKYLPILQAYRDRDGKQGAIANWSHLYEDWAQLKARQTIRFDRKVIMPDVKLALSFLDLYFDGLFGSFNHQLDQPSTPFSHPEPIDTWQYLAGNNDQHSILQWIDNLIQVSWHLMS